MLDLISGEASGHGPVHLLLISAAELGFAWDGDENGWVQPSLPPLGMMSGSVQYFFSSILLGGTVHLQSYLRGKAFGESNLLILEAIYNYLPLPT